MARLHNSTSQMYSTVVERQGQFVSWRTQKVDSCRTADDGTISQSAVLRPQNSWVQISQGLQGPGPLGVVWSKHTCSSTTKTDGYVGPKPIKLPFSSGVEKLSNLTDRSRSPANPSQIITGSSYLNMGGIISISTTYSVFPLIFSNFVGVWEAVASSLLHASDWISENSV